MNKCLKVIFIVFSIIFLLYLAIPSQTFPDPSNKSLQSSEPADVESSLRRGYYNNETRQEVISYYKNKFNNPSLYGKMIRLFSFTLNYPPEESQILIRDQTRSTYLEELVHPLRESLFINGFEPKKNSDTIIVNGEQYKQKIIIKMVYAGFLVRMLVGISALLSIYILYNSWSKYFKNLFS